MGNKLEKIEFCKGPDYDMELKVYGDYFNSDTRTVLNILLMCKVDTKLIEIDTLAPEDS